MREGFYASLVVLCSMAHPLGFAVICIEAAIRVLSAERGQGLHQA